MSTLTQIPQPEHEEPFQEFLNWYYRARYHGCRGFEQDRAIEADFIPEPAVQTYFEDRRRVTRLLKTVFGPDNDLPVGWNVVKDTFPRVFCILLLLGKGSFIDYFSHRPAGLSDKCLPFHQKPPDFPSATDDANFFDNFKARQWEFYPFEFSESYVNNSHIGQEFILPFEVKGEFQGSGASAVVHKIKLHDSYNSLGARTISGQKRNIFVLKTYHSTEDARKYYTSEVEAFRKLNASGTAHPNLIGFYGSYEYRDTFNIILEYADRGTLEDFFQTSEPPRRGDDIIYFWRRLFDVIPPLILIHDITPNEEAVRIFQGYHQDIKPANILVVTAGSSSRYDVHFKLADLGLSHFHSTVGTQATSSGASRGTRTYGSPERYQGSDSIGDNTLPAKRKGDIWSLGCVFSEALTWMVAGRGGLDDYRSRRRDETARIPGFEDGDCFHNGDTVLKIVPRWHRELRRSVSIEDPITERFWDVLIQDMLDNHHARPNARRLHQKSQRFLGEAEESLTPIPTRLPIRAITMTPDIPSQDMQRPETPPQLPPGYSSSQNRPHSGQRNPGTTNTGYGRQSDEILPIVVEGLHSNRHERWRPNSIATATIGQVAASHNSEWFLNTPEAQDDSVTSARNEHWHAIGTADAARSGSPAQASSAGRVGHYRSSSLSIPDETNMDRPTSSEARPGTRVISYSSDNSSPQGSPQQRVRSGDSIAGVLSSPVSSPPTTHTPRVEDIARTPPAYMSVHDLHRWREEKKARGSSNSLPNDQHLYELAGRDHVILVDEAVTMQPHWRKMRELVRDLAYLLKHYDPDGLELYCTISHDKLKSGKATKLDDMLVRGAKKIPSTVARINEILQEYQRKVGADHKLHSRSLRAYFAPEPVRPMTLYVLTDGIFQPSCDAKPAIKNLIDKLEEVGAIPNQIGIQFIQFGNDNLGSERLDEYDSKLVSQYGFARDIVDTESYEDGNVWKMLLGSINKSFDLDPPVPLSPR